MSIFFLVAISITENLLSRNWIPFYFRFGIPVYWKKIALSTPDQWEETVSSILTRLRVNQPPWEFRQLSLTDFAFREKWFISRRESQLRYPPVIHGWVCKPSAENTLSIVGFLNWSSLAFILVAVAFALQENSAAWAVVLILLALNGGVLWYQLGIYGELVRAVTKRLASQR